MQAAAPKVFKVWPENWEAYEMFLRLQTQWRIGLNGVPGIDYSTMRWLFDVYETTRPRELFEDLQLMELAFRGELIKRAS